MTGKPKPLSPKQIRAVKDAERGILKVWGRGCKQSINGLVDRGLVDKARLGGLIHYDCSFWGNLTEDGKRMQKELVG